MVSIFSRINLYSTLGINTKLMREKRGSKYHLKWAIIGAPAKRHLNGVSLAGRCWPNIECLFGTFVAS